MKSVEYTHYDCPSRESCRVESKANTDCFIFLTKTYKYFTANKCGMLCKFNSSVIFKLALLLLWNTYDYFGFMFYQIYFNRLMNNNWFMFHHIQWLMRLSKYQHYFFQLICDWMWAINISWNCIFFYLKPFLFKTIFI